MFCTGDPELKALEQRNLKLRAAAFAAVSRALRRGLAVVAAELRRRRRRYGGGHPCKC